MKFKKIFLTISISSACAFANTNVAEKTIEIIKLGEDIPSIVKKDWKESQDGNIYQYTKKEVSTNFVVDKIDNKVNYKSFSTKEIGTPKKPFYKIQGKVVDSFTKITYKNKLGDYTVIDISKGSKDTKEADNNYKLALEQAKELAKESNYVKVEAVIKTSTKKEDYMKRVISIYTSPENVESSTLYYNNLN